MKLASLKDGLGRLVARDLLCCADVSAVARSIFGAIEQEVVRYQPA